MAQARPSAVSAATTRPSTASGATATRIRVDLSVMRGSAGGINNVGNATNNAAGKLTGVAARAPSYDGQFGPRVQAIAGQSASLAGGIAGRLGGLSGKLNSKANAFEAVDTAALSSVKTLTVPTSMSKDAGFFAMLAGYLKIPAAQIEALLRAGGFLGKGGFTLGALITIVTNLYTSLWKGKTFPATPPPVVTTNNLTITTALNFRSSASMGNNIISALPVNSVVQILGGAPVNKDGHTWIQVKTKDGKTGWIAKDVLTSTSDSPPSTKSTNSAKLSSNRNVLLQTNPVGDDKVLGLSRVVNKDGAVEVTAWGQKIVTVKDHLKAYGCLMTDYTMLLQDKGATVSITDLYKANYEVKTNLSFDQDAKDDKIVLGDLYFNKPDAVFEKVAPGYKAMNSTLDAKQPVESLKKAIQSNGSVIIHVDNKFSDGHWVVADGVNADGTFSIRDPLSGSKNVTFGSGYHSLAEDLAFKYVKK
jgi:uncharacterized protein YgiM (DUF1202 family)